MGQCDCLLLPNCDSERPTVALLWCSWPTSIKTTCATTKHTIDAKVDNLRLTWTKEKRKDLKEIWLSELRLCSTKGLESSPVGWRITGSAGQWFELAPVRKWLMETSPTWTSEGLFCQSLEDLNFLKGTSWQVWRQAARPVAPGIRQSTAISRRIATQTKTAVHQSACGMVERTLAPQSGRLSRGRRRERGKMKLQEERCNCTLKFANRSIFKHFSLFDGWIKGVVHPKTGVVAIKHSPWCWMMLE